MSGYLHWILAATIQVALAEIKCRDGQFACDKGDKCINQDRFCDGQNDCSECSDEIRRNNSEVQTGIPCRRSTNVCMLPERYLTRKDDICTKNLECHDYEFACSDGSACLDMSSFCDGQKDCNDNSDEIRRNNGEVQAGISCRSSRNVSMLPERYLSKRDNFCTKNTECDDSEFACSDGSACLEMYHFCEDGFVYCNDNSDHIRRNTSEVQIGIPCRQYSYVCMLPERYQSRKDDFCTKNTECDENEFVCFDGSACPDMYDFCNGYEECQDGSDEIKRYHSHPYQDSFPCRHYKDICMLPYNQASEKALICIKDPECEDSEFMCADGSKCIPLNDFCNGVQDCSDGSDEIKANSSDSGIRCRLNDRVCILPDQLLARKEKFCKNDVNCDDNQFRCANGNQCLSASDFCDGRKDCDDGSDEVLFKIYSPVPGIKCPSKNLICVLPLSQGDKQDKLCTKESKCGANEFACFDGLECLPKEKFCDGRAHCSDGSDEMKAGSKNPAAVGGSHCRRDRYKCILPNSQKTKKTYICESKFECASNEFGCLDNTQCLPSWWFCDGYADCEDGSDEMSAESSTDGLACRQDRHVCLLPQNQISKKVNFCRRPA